MIKNRLQQILTGENLDSQRALASSLIAELGIEPLDLAAALLFLNHQNNKSLQQATEQNSHSQFAGDGGQFIVKMIRYRLDVGSQHQVSVDTLTKLLVDESGVDKKNIKILIKSAYSLVELPDNMPQDIYLHLKSVEINGRKLDIKRLKASGYRKRGKNRHRNGRQISTKPAPSSPDQVTGG